MKLKKNFIIFGLIPGLMILAIFICCFFIFGFNDLLFTGESPDNSLLRSDYERLLLDTKKFLDENPADKNNRLHLAYIYYYLGQFNDSKKEAEFLIDAGEQSFPLVLLLSRLYYLEGRYESVINLINDEIKKDKFNVNVRIYGEQLLFYSYYQANQYDKMKSLKLIKYIQPVNKFIKLFNSFKDEDVYRVEWNNTYISEINFLSVDPLPVFKVKVNGREIYVFLDTGADTFILDTQTAREMKIKEISSFNGEFTGGLQGKVGLAKADSLTLGNAVINNVPIAIMPVRLFSGEINGNEILIEGIVGTKNLQQFLSTVDYINGKLILRLKTQDSVNKFLDDIELNKVIETPLYLAGLHSIIVSGFLNNRNAVFHLDSGLADENNTSMQITYQALKDFNIPVPETEFNQDVISGGGKGFEEGYVSLDNLGIESFILDSQTAVYTPGEDIYWENDFIVEGQISHNYLKNYKLTLDFDNMRLCLDAAE